MTAKTIQILEDFDSEKEYEIPIRKQIATVLKELKKDKQYQLSDLILKYDGVVTKKKNLPNTKDVFKHVMNVGKKIGMIQEVQLEPIHRIIRNENVISMIPTRNKSCLISRTQGRYGKMMRREFDETSYH